MKLKQILFLVAAVLSLCSACIDPKFNFDDVKIEGRVFVDLEVPVGSFETITLETILKAPGASVTTLMPGKYRLSGQVEISGLGFQFGEGLYFKEAELHMVMLNTLPLDLTLSPVALDADGNPLPDVSVTIQADRTPMIASGNLESPSENPLVLRFTCSNRYMTMQGLRLSFSGQTGAGYENQAPQMDEGLTMTQVYLKMPEGIEVSR